MGVHVVHIGDMGVVVRQRCMVVPVAMGALGHGVMPMIMVPIVVGVRMFVVQGLVAMHMRMCFQQVQADPCQHQYSANPQQTASRPISQPPGQQCPHEGGKRKYRSGARCTKASLRQQIKTQAQAIPTGTYH